MNPTSLGSIDDILQRARVRYGVIRLDLGCGMNKVPGTVGVDHNLSEEVEIVADLEGVLPFSDDSIDTVFLNHVLEHVREPWALIQECHRILRVGGVLHVRVPHYTNPSAYELGHRTYWNSFSLTGVTRNGSKSREQKALFLQRTVIVEPLFLRSILRPIINSYRRLYEIGICRVIPSYEIIFELEKIDGI